MGSDCVFKDRRKPAGWGKFDHDLKAPARFGRPARVTMAGPAARPPAGARDSMTLPDDTPRQTALEAQPDPAPRSAPVDEAPRVLQREPLHLVVVILLIADIIFGLGLAVFAERVLAFRPMAIMGCGLAALGLGILGYFVLFGSGRRGRW
jgi:hypothetical protein